MTSTSEAEYSVMCHSEICFSGFVTYKDVDVQRSSSSGGLEDLTAVFSIIC